jgi:hypothetical protein
MMMNAVVVVDGGFLMLKMLIIIGLMVTASGMMALPVSAQDDDSCSDVVLNAYEITQSACSELDGDEVCYGNATVTIQPSQPNFSQTGDTVDVAMIESLQLSSMNTATEEWGITVLRIHPLLDAEESVMSESDATVLVDLVIFGNVAIENTANGESGFAPMQAFTFESAVADRSCQNAPDSGILVQTPEGAGEITLFVNEVIIDLGSTVYLQAEPANEMTVSVIDGQADVTAFGTTITAPAGSRTSIPLDADGVAASAPVGPVPYTDAELQPLPVVLLSEPVAIAPVANSIGGLVPLAGTWTATTCVDTDLEQTEEVVIEVSEDGTQMTFVPGAVTEFPYTRIETGQYQYVEDPGVLFLFMSVTENHMEAIQESPYGIDCRFVFAR